MEEWTLRKIEEKDNEAVAALIRSVFEELEIPKVGTAYEDSCLDHMFEQYQQPRSVYFVVEFQGQLMGGAGVAPLADAAQNICELQKMYFQSEIRGRGIGRQMMDKCLQSAIEIGFDFCYLETMPFMHAAQGLYKKVGFEYLAAPLGGTGHCSCPVWMLKNLKA